MILGKIIQLGWNRQASSVAVGLYPVRHQTFAGYPWRRKWSRESSKKKTEAENGTDRVCLQTQKRRSPSYSCFCPGNWSLKKTVFWSLKKIGKLANPFRLPRIMFQGHLWRPRRRSRSIRAPWCWDRALEKRRGSQPVPTCSLSHMLVAWLGRGYKWFETISVEYPIQPCRQFGYKQGWIFVS